MTTGAKEIMKNMMKFLLAAFGAVVLCSCGGGSDTPGDEPTPVVPGELVGQWKLSAWSDDADGAIAAGKIQVYLDLANNSTFTLYQNFNKLGFTRLTGTYAFIESTKTISGTYSDGVPWSHTYTLSDLTSASMKWTSSGSNDVATYTKTTIPTDLVDGTKAVLASEEPDFRFL